MRRIAKIAQDLIRQRVVTIVAAICPYHAIRAEVRAIIGEFIEIFVNCPLEVCISRDPKGLYRKALSGEIKNFTGIGDIFEVPLRPDIEVTTHAETPEESLTRILSGLEELRRILPEPFDPLKGKEENPPQSRPS
jgi:adenylylsulfate kinase